jgi:hypothetical protein
MAQMRSADVIGQCPSSRCRKYLLALSSSQFDPSRTLQPPGRPYRPRQQPENVAPSGASIQVGDEFQRGDAGQKAIGDRLRGDEM